MLSANQRMTGSLPPQSTPFFRIFLEMFGLSVVMFGVFNFVFNALYGQYYRTLISCSISFILSLLIYHFYLRKQRHRYTAQILRIIDYIYLSAACISILGATQIDKDIVTLDYDYLYDEFRDDRGFLLTKFDDAVRKGCSMNIKEICNGGSEFWVKNIARAKEQSDKELVRTFDDMNGDAWFRVADAMKEFQEISQDIGRLTGAYKKWEGVRRELIDIDPVWRGLALMLLLQALALRITRVTVETRGWNVHA
jgi:hypothetical protein